jgi:hypothetical protein
MKPVSSGPSLFDQHPVLFATARAVIRRVADLPQGLIGSSWHHHRKYAERAAQVSEHLDAAVLLAEDRRYATALAVVRIAFEQSCLDELLLLADRYTEMMTAGVAEYRDLKGRWRQGEEDWARTLFDLSYRNGKIRLVRTGYPVYSPEGVLVEHLSPYEAILDEHDAMLGPLGAQDALAQPFSDPERLKEWAKRSQLAYHQYLSWSGIVDNLRLNELATERQVLELSTHYRFLSAFTHATTAGYRSLNPQRGFPGAQYLHDHLVAELVLLYASAVGASELRAFMTYVDGRRELELTARVEIEQTTSAAVEAIRYFWFPRLGEPMPFDFFQEANRRAFPGGEFERDVSAPRPDEISPEEVSYYANPLDRLERLHVGGAEVSTGYAHAPLWP